MSTGFLTVLNPASSNYEGYLLAAFKAHYTLKWTARLTRPYKGMQACAKVLVAIKEQGLIWGAPKEGHLL